jgi:LysR family transcriptional regulator, glycine cleavage system transcriptional activator
MHQLPSLKALRTFEAAARHLSFTRAADELGVTQTAVSHQIKTLEARLNTLLFHRSNNSLVLTPKGEEYFQSLYQAFELVSRATERLLHNPAKDTITVGVMATFAVRWLIPRLSIFKKRHPDIEIAVRLLPNVGTSDFARDRLDFIIRAGSGWPEYDCLKLVPITIVPVCSPNLLHASVPLRTPADLANHTLLRVSSAAVDEWRLWFQSVGVSQIESDRGPIFDSYTLAWQAASEGLGVAMGRMPLVAGDLEAGRLVRPFSREVVTGRAWYLLMQKGGAENRKLAAFRDWMLAEAQRTDPVLAQVA